MTEEEIKILESARSWIQADANMGVSPWETDEAEKLADKIDEIIQRYKKN